MLRKLLIGSAFMAMAVLLNPDYSSGQFGGKGGRGKGGFPGGPPGGGPPGSGGTITLQPPGGGYPGGGKGGFGGGKGDFRGGKGDFRAKGDFGGGKGGGYPGGPGGGSGYPGGPGGYPGKGGGTPGSDGKGGGGGRNPDPDRTFAFFAAGGDTIDFNKMSPDQQKFVGDRFERYGLPRPSNNAIITKDQFVTSLNQASASRGMIPGGGPGAPRSDYPGAPGGGYPGAPGGGYPGAPGGGGFSDEQIEQRFRSGDRDRDGRLSYDEASDRTKQRFQEFDVNRDGYLDLNEYKQLNYATMGGSPTGPGYPGYDPRNPSGGGYDRSGRDVKKAPDIFAIRFGKLPEGLPSWWDSRDTNRDGQIGFDEWRAAGEDMAQFRELDTNGDWVLAPSEYLRYQRQQVEDAKIAAIEAGERPASEQPSNAKGSGSGGGSSRFGPGSGGSSKFGPGGSPGDSGKGDKKGDKRGNAGPWGNGGKKGR